MSHKLAGKVAVVTGASKGIGASIARHLAAEGAAIVVNYASSQEGANKVVAEITAAGGGAVAVKANVEKKRRLKRCSRKRKSSSANSISSSITPASTNSAPWMKSPRRISTACTTSTCSASS